MRKIDLGFSKEMAKKPEAFQSFWAGESEEQSNLLEDSCLETSPPKETLKTQEGNLFFRGFDSIGPNEFPDNGFESFQCRKDLRESEQKAKGNPFRCNPELLQPKLICHEDKNSIEKKDEDENEREALKPLNIANNIMTPKKGSSNFEDQKFEEPKIEGPKNSFPIQTVSLLPKENSKLTPRDISLPKSPSNSISRPRENSISRPKEKEQKPGTSSRSLIPSHTSDQDSFLKRPSLFRQPNATETDFLVKEEKPACNPRDTPKEKTFSEPSFTELLIFFMGIKKEFGAKSDDPQSVLAEIKRHNLAITEKLKETLSVFIEPDNPKTSKSLGKKQSKKIDSSSSDESSSSDSSDSSDDSEKIKISCRKNEKVSYNAPRSSDPTRIIKTIDAAANSFQLKLRTISHQRTQFEQHISDTKSQLLSIFQPLSQPLGTYSEQAFVIQISNYFSLFLERAPLHPEDLASALIRTEQFAARRFEDYYASAPFLPPEVSKGVADFCSRFSFAVTLYCSANTDRSKVLFSKNDGIESIIYKICNVSPYFCRIHEFIDLSVYTKLNRIFAVLCKQGFFGIELVPDYLKNNRA